MPIEGMHGGIYSMVCLQKIHLPGVAGKSNDPILTDLKAPNPCCCLCWIRGILVGHFNNSFVKREYKGEGPKCSTGLLDLVSRKMG